MARKRYSAEQIISMLRQAEIELASEHTADGKKAPSGVQLSIGRQRRVAHPARGSLRCAI